MQDMDCPGLPTQEGCSGMWTHQPGAATPIKVTGQSGQSKLLTIGEHRPGGPTIAEPDDSDVRPACSYNAQPDSEAREAEAREAEAELGLGGMRYVTRGELPLPQRAPPVREPVRVGGGKFRYRSGIKEATAKAVDPRRKDRQLCLSMLLYSCLLYTSPSPRDRG